MPKRLKRVWCLVLVGLLASCQLLPDDQGMADDWLLQQSDWHNDDRVQRSALFHFQSQGQSVEMPVEVTFSRSEWNFVGFSHIGGPIFVVRLQGETLVQQRAPVLPERLQANTMLRDLQLAYLPEPFLLDRILYDEFSLVVLPQQRQVLWRGQPMIDMHFTSPGDSVEFTNRHERYTWKLTFLEPAQD